jgi:hypothetical protein
LVETFRPSEADAIGIGYRQLAPRNPRLVYAAISTYGQWGPEASRQRAKRDREVADQALAGILHITGERPSGPDPEPHEVPTKAGAWLGWYAGGAWAAFGVLAALRWRERSGRGQMVDVSGEEAIMRWMEDMVAYYQRAGVLRERLGLIDTSVFPYTFVPTRDGHAMIAGFSDVNFTALTTIMGKEHLLQDPRFTTFLDRLKPESPQGPLRGSGRVVEGANLAGDPEQGHRVRPGQKGAGDRRHGPGEPPEGQQRGVDAVLQRGPVPDQVQPEAGPLPLRTHPGRGQPDCGHQLAAAQLRQHPRVDPVGLARQRRQAL